jgi:CDP-diacylglycerol--serine O-phosphatidyltransferase
LLIASLPLIAWYTTSPTVAAALQNKWVLYGLILLVAWLMTSKLPLMAMKFQDYTVRGNWPKLVLVVLAVVSAIFLKWLAVPMVFIFYIVVSLIAKKKVT